MKLFLAGCEDFPFLYLTEIAQHPYTLFSYYHWNNTSPSNKRQVDEIWERYPQEIICDSGLFTLMFGVGKGGNYDMPFMREYTEKYIRTAKTFKAKTLTIVESDVHKLLGMPAVFELRKQFEDSGMKVLYVWHREEGIDGLFRMAEKYDYIAISVPELRILCKGKVRYQDAVKDLERQIAANVSRIPKIHLLGNTVAETMQTRISYSCDSTSWLAGGRWGRFIHYEDGKLKAKKISEDDYRRVEHIFRTQYVEQFEKLKAQYGHRSEKYLPYILTMYLSAKSYNLYQQMLDRKFQCIEGVTNGNQGKSQNGSNLKARRKPMESKRPK